MSNTALHVAVHALNQEFIREKYPAFIVNKTVLIPQFFYGGERKGSSPWSEYPFKVDGDNIFAVHPGVDLATSHPGKLQVGTFGATPVFTTPTGLDVTPVVSQVDFYALLNSKQLAETLRLQQYLAGMADFIEPGNSFVQKPFEYLDDSEKLNGLYAQYLATNFMSYHSLGKTIAMSTSEVEESDDGES